MNKVIELLSLIGNDPEKLNLLSSQMSPEHLKHFTKIKEMDDQGLRALTPESPEGIQYLLNSIQDEHAQNEIVDDVLGINGGHPIKVPDVGDGLSDTYEYSNWNSGPKYNPALAEKLLSTRHNLQPYQVDHVMKNGTPQEKLALFQNQSVDEQLRRKMYDMWCSDKNGYNLQDLQSHLKSKLNNVNYYDGKLSDALDEEMDNYPYDQYLQDNVSDDDLAGITLDDHINNHLDARDWSIKDKESGNPIFDLSANKELHPSYEKWHGEATGDYDKLLQEKRSEYNDVHHRDYLSLALVPAKVKAIQSILEGMNSIEKDESLLPFKSSSSNDERDDLREQDMGNGIMRHYHRASLPKNPEGSSNKVKEIIALLSGEHKKSFPVYGYMDYDTKKNMVKDEKEYLNPAIQSILHSQKRYKLAKTVGEIIKKNHRWKKETLKKYYPPLMASELDPAAEPSQFDGANPAVLGAAGGEVGYNGETDPSRRTSDAQVAANQADHDKVVAEELSKKEIDFNTLKILTILDSLQKNKEVLQQIKQTNPEALESLISLLDSVQLMMDGDRG